MVRVQYLLQTEKVFSLWGEDASSGDVPCWSEHVVFQELLSDLWSGVVPDWFWENKLLSLSNCCWDWFSFRSFKQKYSSSVFKNASSSFIFLLTICCPITDLICAEYDQLLRRWWYYFLPMGGMLSGELGRWFCAGCFGILGLWRQNLEMPLPLFGIGILTQV